MNFRIPSFRIHTSPNAALCAKVVWLAMGLFMGEFFLTRPLGAQEPRALIPMPSAPKLWALVVAVEQDSVSAGRACRTNDAEWLADQLTRSGYSRDRMLLMTRRAAESKYHPLRKHLEKQIPEFLRRIGPEDGLLIYWTGKAYEVAGGPLVWAAADWDCAQPSETGLSVVWLQEQLASCQAAWKLALIDVPFDREQTAVGIFRSTNEQAAQVLRQTPKLAVLASSQGQQGSLLWEMVGQSVFGFWVAEAMRGHADRDRNNQIRLQELFDYVFAKVSKTAQEVHHKEQTPVLWRTAEGNPSEIVGKVSPTTLPDVVEQLAAQVADQAAQHRVSQLAVVEFRPLASESSEQAVLDGDVGPGILGRWCAEALEKALQQKAPLTGFRLIPSTEFQTTLVRSQLTPQTLETSDVRGLQVQGQSVEAVVLGAFSVRSGPLLSIQWKLKHLSTSRILAQRQLAAMLNLNELGMLGVPIASSLTLGPPKAPSPAHPYAPQLPQPQPQPVEIPPQIDPKFPFRVKIYVDGKHRPPRWIGQKEYVFLKRGEVYQIVVENHLAEPVYMRILVDGLNTLPEPVPVSAASLEKKTYVYLPGRRVHLEKARAWLLEARPPDAPARQYAIQGFYRRMESTSPGKALYEWETFKVVDAPQSWAAQQHYTEQLGLITAAFYAVPSDVRGGVPPGAIGTGPGPPQKGELQEYPESPVGPLRSVIHLYYALPSSPSQVPSGANH